MPLVDTCVDAGTRDRCLFNIFRYSISSVDYALDDANGYTLSVDPRGRVAAREGGDPIVDVYWRWRWNNGNSDGYEQWQWRWQGQSKSHLTLYLSPPQTTLYRGPPSPPLSWTSSRRFNLIPAYRI